MKMKVLKPIVHKDVQYKKSISSSIPIYIVIPVIDKDLFLLEDVVKSI